MSLRWWLGLALVALPGFALAGGPLGNIDIRTSGGFLFDVMADSFAMLDGTRDAYDRCYMLRVDGAEVRLPSATVLFGGRGVLSPRTQVSGVTVSRQVFVPEQGDWARYYDLFINDTKTTRTVGVEIYGNLGSDSSTKIVTTSSGDAILETTDGWAVTDDHTDGGGDPALGHVFRRARGKLRPEAVSLVHDDISFRYRLELRPRKSAAIVFFAVQANTGDEAAELSRQLSAFGVAAKARLSAADIGLIAN